MIKDVNIFIGLKKKTLFGCFKRKKKGDNNNEGLKEGKEVIEISTTGASIYAMQPLSSLFANLLTFVIFFSLHHWM